MKIDVEADDGTIHTFDVPDDARVSRLGAAPCSLPSQFRGPFFGRGMGKVFIKTKQGDTGVLDIRGWGYLTGQGSLAMGEDEACKVQNQFEEWVIAALNLLENSQDHAPEGSE